jgi:hypothetical protein
VTLWCPGDTWARSDAAKLKGLEGEIEAFAKAGISPEGIGQDQFAALDQIVTEATLPKLLGRDGYVGAPGETTYMIANIAFIGGNFLDRVRRDTAIKYNTMVGGGAPSPGCTWATVSNPQR